MVYNWMDGWTDGLVLELMRAKENRVLNKRNIITESNRDKQRETKRRTELHSD